MIWVVTGRIDYCNALQRHCSRTRRELRLTSCSGSWTPPLESSLVYSEVRPGFDAHPPRRTALHWLDVPQRVTLKLCVTVYKCLHGLAPQYLSELCVPVADVAGRRQLRSVRRGLLYFPRYNMSNYCRHAFSYAGPHRHAWNLLAEIRKYSRSDIYPATTRGRATTKRRYDVRNTAHRRPVISWRDNITTWTGLTTPEATKTAQDRDSWRRAVHSAINQSLNDKNSSGDEIANVNFLRRYRTRTSNTKKENLLRLTN